MIKATTREALSRALLSPRGRGVRLALVPTMGFLHEGHLSLVDLAKETADVVAVSIFVNPIQFGPGEDLERYPRDLERDLSQLRERGADIVFCPGVKEMYPDGSPRVTVDPGAMGTVLCGAYRPGHFRGVLTVVARLFGIFRPDLAVFGHKDYQQAVLIRRMTRDLELGAEILLGPIVREADGLALSSRNVYLSPDQRAQARGLYAALIRVQEAFDGGERSNSVLRRILAGAIQDYPLLELQYGEIVTPDTLEPAEPVEAGSVVALAAYCGPTRLIDNHVLVGGTS